MTVATQLITTFIQPVRFALLQDAAMHFLLESKVYLEGEFHGKLQYRGVGCQQEGAGVTV